MKRFISILIFVVLAAAGGVVWWQFNRPAHPPAIADTVRHTQPSATKKATSLAATTFDKQQYSLTDPTSQWVIVNKKNPLIPKDYAPTDLVVPDVPLRVPGNVSMQLRKITAGALQTMFAAAKQQGIDLMLSSGYRPYTYQVSLYNSYVQAHGQQQADTFSARPGYSEHQTGLAADVEPVSEKCDVDQCFATLPEGKWLAANAYKCGFIIRYPNGKDNITGYEYEPWHVRYVGVALATEMHTQGISTLEEFFNLPAAPNY